MSLNDLEERTQETKVITCLREKDTWLSEECSEE